MEIAGTPTPISPIDKFSMHVKGYGIFPQKEVVNVVLNKKNIEIFFCLKSIKEKKRTQ